MYWALLHSLAPTNAIGSLGPANAVGKADRFVKIETLNGGMVGQRVEFRARVQKVMPSGSSLTTLDRRLSRCANACSDTLFREDWV